MTHLSIKDLHENTELDARAMAAVSGGSADIYDYDYQGLMQQANAGLVALNNAVQTMVGVNTSINLPIDIDVL